MIGEIKFARITSIMDGTPLVRNFKNGTSTLVWVVGMIDCPPPGPPRAYLVAEYQPVNDCFEIGVAYKDELELYIKPQESQPA